MSKQANKTVIGFFVVGALVLVVVAIVVLGSGKLFKKTSLAVCYFEGSVGGLNVGAPVVFRGVKIGTVTEVAFRFDPKKVSVTIPVYIELEQQRKGVTKKETIETYKRLIERGLKAQLEMQSIVTGQLQIALDFYPDKPTKFVKEDPDYFEIPTVQSPLQELTKKIEKIPIDEIFQKILSAVEGIEKVVNNPDIKEAIRSVNLALADVRKLVQNVDGQIGPLASNVNGAVQDVRKLVQNADTQVTGLASNLDAAVKDVRELVQNADVKVTGLASSLDETVKDVRGLIKNVDNRIGPLAAGLEDTIKSAETTLKGAQRAIEKIEGTVSEDSTLVYELNKTLEEVSALARSIRILSDYLERHPESVLWGK
jgi:paraquat-inducible protein B